MRLRPPLATQQATSPLLDTALIPPVLRHLHQLTGSFECLGQTISYINIYARPCGSGRRAPIEFIIARESGFEGIACVDDAARAIILALTCYEQTGKRAALDVALTWLPFLAYMQRPDGRFYNFICDQSGTINMRGRTSYAGGAWWNARAMHALAAAFRVTGGEEYRRRFEAGRFMPTGDMKVRAVHALALLELYAVDADPAIARRVRRACDAIVARGAGYFRDRAGRDSVAMWGYHQLQAVARAGHVLARDDYIDACEATVTNLVEPIIERGFFHEFPGDRYHLCVYDVSALALGLEELYRATGAPRFAHLAMRCARWLEGQNHLGVPLYDPRTGRCSDGFAGEAVSANCGAESSIEAGYIALMRRRLAAMPGVVGDALTAASR